MKLGFILDENEKFITDYLVPAKDMQKCFQEAEFDDEVFYPDKVQGYKITYVDRVPHASFSQEQWEEYQETLYKEEKTKESQVVFEELSKTYTLTMASDADAYKMRYLYPDFDPSGYLYKKDDRFFWSQNEKFYKVLQDHTSQNSPDRKPDVAVSLYVEIPDPAIEYPEWKQPTGAHDAYYKGNKVTFEGAKYICIAPDGVACTWSPTQYPTYWEKVES